MNFKIKPPHALIFIWSLCFSSISFAQTFDNGGGDNLWSNGTNWNPDGVPAAGATVTIQGYTVIVNSNETVGTVNIIGTTANNFLDIQTGGTLNIANDLTLTVANDNNHNDIVVQGTGVLNVGNDFTITRPTTNTRNRRVRLLIRDDGDCNVTNDFLYTYGRGDEGDQEVLVQDNGTFDVTGNFTIEQTGDGNDATVRIRNNAVLTVGGDYTMNQSDGNSSVLDLLESGNVTITGDLELICTNHDNNPRIDMDDDCVLNVGDSLIIDMNGGNDCNIYLNDNSDLNITRSLFIDKDGGDDFELDMTDTPTIDIGENLIGSNVSDGNDDYITMDINGGTITVVGSSNFDVGATSTSNAFVMFQVDGATYNTNGFTYDQNGGFDGDMRLYINRNQTATAAIFNNTGNIQFDHDGGDDMEIEINANSTVTVIGTTTLNLNTSADNDNMYLDINGGTSTFTGAFAMNMGIGVTADSDLDVRMDQCTVNYGDGFSFDVDGGDETIWDVNTNASVSASDINVTGNLVIDHDGGDNSLVRSYGNADIDLSGDLIVNITSASSDDFELQLRSDVTMDFRDFLYTQDGGGSGSGENCDVFIHGNAVLTVDDIIANLDTGNDFEIYVNENGAYGNGGRLVVADSISVDHELTAGDFYLRNSVNGTGSNIRVGTIYIDWVANGGDLIRIHNHGTDDSLIVTNNIDIVMTGGVTGTDDDIRIDVNTGYFNVGGDIQAYINAGDAVSFNSDDATVVIGGDMDLRADGGRFTTFDIDGTIATIGDSLILASADPASGGGMTWRVDDGSILTVTTSVLIDHNGGGDVNAYFGADGANTGKVNITNDLVFDHDADPDDINVFLYEESLLSIGRDWLATHIGNGGARIQVFMSATNDTITVTNDINWTMSGGTPNTEDDFYINMDGGYFNVGGDFHATSTGGSEFEFDADGGVINIDGGVYVDWDNSYNIRWLMNNVSSSIGTDLNFNNNTGNQTFFDIDAGTHSIGRDEIINMTNCTNSCYHDIDGGSWSITEDLLYTIDGATTTDFFIDGTSTFSVGDSLFMDLNTSSNVTRFYINTAVGSGALVTIDDLYIDHEATAHDVLFRTDNDARFNVTNSFVADHDASGGDYMEIEMLGANDTIVIGGDLIFTMVSGTNNGDDDMRIDVNSGFLDIGNDLQLVMSGMGAGCIYEQAGGDVNVGRNFDFNTDNSRELNINIDAGTLDVVGDVNLYHGTTNNTNNFSWDQDGGVVTVNEDMNIQINGNNASYFHLDNASILNVTDSISIDIDLAQATFEWYLNNNSGTGALLTANEVYLNHAGLGDDFRVLLNGDARMQITSNIVFDHTASNGDFIEIQLNNANDSLIVGNNLVYTVNGSDDADDDVYFDSHGYANIGNDFLVTATDVGGLRLEQTGGEIFVGRYMTWTQNSSQEYLIQTDNATLTVTDDMTLNWNGVDPFDMDWNADVADINLNQDFYFNKTGGRESDFRFDNNTTFDIVDSLYMNLDVGTSRTYFQVGSAAAGASDVTIGSHFYVDHEQAAGDFLIQLNNDGKLDVNNSITLVHDAADDDFSEINLLGGNDTLLVGDDVLMTMPSSGSGSAGDDLRFDVDRGYVSIGRDLIMDIQNGGGDVRYEQADGDVDIGRYMSLLNQGGGQVLNADIDAGTLDVGDDLTFTHANEQADFDANWDQDGGIVTLAQDAYININDNDFTNIDLDQGSTLIITDSLVIDLDASTESFRIDLDGNAGSGSHLNIGSHLYIDHETSAEDIYIETNSDSRIDIGVDLTVVFDSNIGRLELEMNGSDDTVVVGRDLLFNQPSGTGNAQDDIEIDQNGGLLDIGRDVIMTLISGDDLLFQKADGDANVGRYLTMISNSSDAFTVRHDAGTLDVVDDVTLTHNNSVAPANFAFDVHGGDMTFNQDLYFTQNGNNESNWYLDDNFTLTVADSVFFDLDAANGILRFYINDDLTQGTGGFVNIGNHFYVDHEANSHDFRVRVDNDGRLDVGTDFTVITDAAGGDYVMLELETANDTVNIGRDLLFTMTSGSANADDDLLFDNAGGRFNVGRDVVFDNTGGGSVRFDHITGTTQDSDIGRYLTLTSTSARDIGLNTDGGTIDVVDDITINHTTGTGFNLEWDQDGGAVTTQQDIYFNINGNAQSNIYIGTGSLTVADTLLMNHDASSAIMRIFAHNDGLIDVNGNIIMDHEVGAADMQIRTTSDGMIDVANNIHAYHDAAGGDFCEIEVANPNDTLLVGNDIIMNMSSGANNADDDLIIDIDGGFVNIGNDVSFIGTAGTDLEFRVADGDVNIGRYLMFNGDNIDDNVIVIDGGTIDVTDDVIMTLNASDDNVTNFDGGTFNANSDMTITMNGGCDDVTWNSRNASIVNVSDSLFFDLNSLDFTSFYFNDDASTGSRLNVGNDIVFDHEINAGDILNRLDGDARIDVTDGYYVLHDASGGDYFEIEFEEDNGTDTLIIGGVLDVRMTTGSTGTDDDLRFDQNGGYAQVGGDFNYIATAGDDIVIDNSSGTLNALSNVNLSVTDADDAVLDQAGLATHVLNVNGNVNITGLRSDILRTRFGGTSATINGQLNMTSDDSPLDGHTVLDINSGVNTIVGATNLTVNNANDRGDADIDIDGGTNVFQSNVTMTVTDNSDNSFVRVAGASNTSLQDSLVINVNTSSDNVQFDIDTGVFVVAEDIIINHSDGVDFIFDQDGGTFTVTEDFVYNANTTRRTETYLDQPTTSFNVGDSLIYNLDVTSDFYRFWLDNNVDGSTATVGTFYIDHEAAAQDVLVRLAGDATFTVQNDMHFDHDAITGDYLEIEVLGTNDSLIIGRDLYMNHTGGNNNGDDLRIDMNNGYMQVGEDLYMTFDGASTADQDVEITMDGSAIALIGDSLFVDLNNNDDFFFYFNTASGTDAYLSAGNVVIDKEVDADDSRIRLNGGSSKLETTGNMSVFMDGATGDFFELDINGTNDSLIIGNDFLIQYNNSNTGNGNSDLRIDAEGGVIYVANDFEVNFVSGNDCEMTLDNNAVIDVDNDFTINQDGGDLTYLYLNSGTGDPQMLVGRDFIMDYSGGSSFVLQMNDASTAVIGRDTRYDVPSQSLQIIDLNDNSEYYIARNFVRGASPNNFGRLSAADNATVIYNGAGSQIFSEDAGGGTDFFQYENVTVNNTSGLLPAVIMESVDGGGATINGGLVLTEGQVDINSERIYINNTAPGAVSRTNGSVLSDRTDNSSTMEWQMDAVAGIHLFPFSTAAGEYIPFIFETTAGNIGKVDVATYPTNSAATPNNLPYPTTPDAVTEMNRLGNDNTLNVVDRFWQIDKDGASGTANMTWTYTDTELGGANTITENLLGAQRWNGSSWDPIVGTADAPNNQVTANGITTFSPWVLVQNDEPLPVELLSFNATVNDDVVELTWATASEINSAYFVVERSVDGVNFEAVTNVVAAGNSSAVLNYSAVDNSPISGESYYRLKQVDLDGTEYNSDLVYIHISSSNDQFDVLIFPNPVQHNENFYIQAHGVEEHIDVTMIDAYGRTVFSGKVDIEPEGHAEMHTKHLAAGVYTVYISDGKTQVVKRVLISK